MSSVPWGRTRLKKVRLSFAPSASLTTSRSGRWARTASTSSVSIVFSVAFFACGIRPRRTVESRSPCPSTTESAAQPASRYPPRIGAITPSSETTTAQAASGTSTPDSSQERLARAIAHPHTGASSLPCAPNRGSSTPSPRTDVSRIAPASQAIRRRNNPSKSRGDPTKIICDTTPPHAEQETQYQREVLGESVAPLRRIGRAPEPDAGLLEPPQHQVLHQLEVAALETRNAKRGSEMRGGGRRQLPDLVLRIHGSAAPHPKLVAIAHDGAGLAGGTLGFRTGWP